MDRRTNGEAVRDADESRVDDLICDLQSHVLRAAEERWDLEDRIMQLETDNRYFKQMIAGFVKLTEVCLENWPAGTTDPCPVSPDDAAATPA